MSVSGDISSDYEFAGDGELWSYVAKMPATEEELLSSPTKPKESSFKSAVSTAFRAPPNPTSSRGQSSLITENNKGMPGDNKVARPTRNRSTSSSRRQPYPTSSPRTPSKKPTGEWTEEHSTSVNTALAKLRLNESSSPIPSGKPAPSPLQPPTNNCKRKGIVIDSDSENEVSMMLTDIEPSQLSMRTSSMNESHSFSTSTSISSASSLFSIISTSTSMSSIGEHSTDSQESSTRSPPKVRRLSSQGSVSGSKPKFCEKLTGSPRRQFITSPNVDDVFGPTQSFHVPKRSLMPPSKSNHLMGVPFPQGDIPSISSPGTGGKNALPKPHFSVPSTTISTSSSLPSSSASEKAATPLPRANAKRATSSKNAIAFPQSVLNFKIGTDSLPTVLIAHCLVTQTLFDKQKISWGVQYELARGVSIGKWSWEDVRSKLGRLMGTSAESAYRVRSVMLGEVSKRSNKKADLSIWRELDREDKAIKENQGRGLGLMGTWEDESDWYGGQIQQLGRLVKHEDKSYAIQLEPLEKRRSHRFARYCGSRRMLQIRVSDKLIMNESSKVKGFLARQFVLCGRVFVPFHAKDNGVYLVEINEDYERQPQQWCGDETRLSFSDFINWHNPIMSNFDQPISKYAARFALGLSNSIPAIKFEKHNIIFIDDIYAADWKGGKTPADKIMTDGCGFMNRAALLAITKKFQFDSLRTAVQGRIAGAKGMWMLHPYDKSDDAKIWIRKSQNKVSLPDFDRAHSIFDLLTASQSSSSISLSQQSIVNLSFNGVPHDLLISLLEQGLVDEIMPLMDWTRPQAMVFLWDTINKSGYVSGSRSQRLAAGASRALGLQGRDWGHDNVDADAILDDEAPSNTGRNEYSGAPLSLHESALELVQAGFHPAKMEYLREKIKWIVHQVIKSSVEKYKIPLQESLGGFILPDPLGVLNEGQIFYRSTRPLKDPVTETMFHVLTGEVILGRYPIRLPSDMQKVTAVDIRDLYDWPDVVIVSTKGSFSLASLLSGGDMDGDDIVMVKNTLIVEFFRNQPFTTPPANLMDDFEREVEQVDVFCQRVQGSKNRVDAQLAFQEVLLLNLNSSKVGLYSMFHDNAVQLYGYSDPKTIRLAYVFATLLDASKTGHRLKPGVFDRDQGAFGQKPRSSTMFILDRLARAAKAKGDGLLAKFEATVAESTERVDKDLERPYKIASEQACDTFEKYKFKGFREELDVITDVVKKAHSEWMDACKRSRDVTASTASSPQKKPRFKSAKSDQEDLMLQAARTYAEGLAGKNLCLISNAQEVMASYAYYCNQRFAFSVAFRELCHIKAGASKGGIAPTARIFDEAKTISSTALRALTKNDADDDF